MKVTVLRHGKTAANITHEYCGRYYDAPLCDEGIETARGYGEDLSLERVYVTPLSRTHQTAKLLFPAAEQVVVENLAEMDFGDFEHRSYADMADDPAYRAWVDSGCNDRCPNGETRAEFTERTCKAFDELVAAAAARGEERVVIVAHGGTLMAVMGEWAQPSKPYWEWISNGCCGYRFTIDPATWANTHVITDFEHVSGHEATPQPDMWHDPTHAPKEQ